ncbi:MAG: hypothetical protein HOP28_06820 [Gemmatimonadales bacterium]|nr:hypothetical protein [Gemmatimonadales bacterium]
MNRRFAAVALLVLAYSTAANAQQRLPARLLGPVEAVGSEPFSQVRGFRELSDGRVIVTDQREKKIVLLDLAKKTAVSIGRVGGGPGEFQTATDLIGMPGDTTLLIDVGRGLDRLSVILPDGKIDGSVILPQNTWTSYLFQVDRAGRLYFPERVISASGGAPRDSVPVLRVDLRRKSVDTAFSVRAVRRGPGVPSDPYNPRPQWAVDANGRAAVVEVEDYRVTWIAPDGKRTRGAPISFERLAVTERDKEEFRALARRISGLGTGLATPTGTAARPPALEFPEYKPPFFGNNAVMFAPNGELWVRRSQPASEKGLVHDIIGAAGVPVATITLPVNTVLLALGVRGVYLAHYDDDDLIRIERYRYP